MKKITKLLAISGVLPIFATPLIVSCENKKDKEIKRLQGELDKLKKELTTTQASLTKVNDDLTKTTTEKEALIKQQENLAKQIKELEAKIKMLNDPKYQAAKEILQLRDKLENEKSKNKLNNLVYPTKEESGKIAKLLDKYIKKIDEIDKSNLNSDSLSWLNGIKYDWEIEKGNHESGLRYLLSNFNWGPSGTYVANSFYRTINLKPNQGKKAKLWLETLKEAINEKIVPSKVFIKNNIKSFLQTFYAQELEEFLKSSDEEATVESIISKRKARDKENQENIDAINEFYKFYATTYYKASEYGKGEDLSDLKVYKSNKHNEKENTIEINNKSIYGLGLTQKDLDQNEAGIGYIKGKDGKAGKRIYDQLSKMNTTSSLTPEQVYKKGIDSTKSAADNMKRIATEVAKLIAGDTGEWKATFEYDEDGNGPSPKKTLTEVIRDASGNIDLDKFNKWLNSEDFFFGREKSSYYTKELKNKLDTDPNLEFARKELTKFGYDFLKGSNAQYASITEDQFYYGALEAFKAYKQFKDSTQKYGASFFGKPVPDYDIQTYEYQYRDSEGVGAYDSSVKKFMFNADPYYSLPKWSVTSFANHESMMGHHNQIMYADHHLAKIGDLSLGNAFDYTSYVEGWALFMEWFGIENGFYGKPNYESTDYYAMPKDFSTAKGITSFVKDANNLTTEQINKIKELHGGVYWDKVNGANDKERAQKALKLANMLQYYGALNEAQLRNMRLAVDSIYHGSEINNAAADLPKGASISQVREYMKKNSALGIGDITSESKRYFNNPGQAVSYNSGKEVMLDLYKRVHQKLGLTREQFINATNAEYGEHGEIKKFFDILLRNGGLPLEALKQAVEKAYNL